MARYSAPGKAGIGLRLPHLAEMVATRPRVAWLEIHPENFLANAHATELLEDLARDYPISVHTVGVSVGSADGIDRCHLARVRTLVDRIDPIFVSGHLAWSTHAGEYLNDLLPLPYTEETLRIVSDHIREVQDALGRRYLLENPSSYVAFSSSTMSEVEFLLELSRRSSCGLLCDVSNIYLSSRNMEFDPYAYVDGLDASAVSELHLGGFTPEPDDSRPGMELLVDTHATPVADPAWELYAYAVGQFGLKPTLIEWDNDIPSLNTLIGEAARADATARASLAPAAHHAVAR
ncbi:MAG TPA: DUF692 domain-containing protein [Vicinamibacterales bacterium]|nr:DUF692 domain-containing protein [Vicinamibacterales bacterium]